MHVLYYQCVEVPNYVHVVDVRMEYTKYKKGLITHSIKLNKVCQCLLFTHVLTLPCKFNNENVRIYSSLTQFSRVSPQKNNYKFLIYICIVLYCIYAKQIIHSTHNKTWHHQAHLFINFFTTVL